MVVTTLANALTTTSRIPFSEFEVKFTIEFLRISLSKGRDLQLGLLRDPLRHGEIESILKDGIFLIFSRALEHDFVFLKCDGGRNFWGRQKSVFATYVGSEADGELVVGATFTNWALALSSVGNVFRGYGLR
jgi:hypothetical protein